VASDRCWSDLRLHGDRHPVRRVRRFEEAIA
jgi:hypothetical protein